MTPNKLKIEETIAELNRQRIAIDDKIDALKEVMELEDQIAKRITALTSAALGIKADTTPALPTPPAPKQNVPSKKIDAKEAAKPEKGPKAVPAPGWFPNALITDAVREVLRKADKPMRCCEIFEIVQPQFPHLTSSTLSVVLRTNADSGLVLRTGKPKSYKFSWITDQK